MMLEITKWYHFIFVTCYLEKKFVGPKSITSITRIIAYLFLWQRVFMPISVHKYHPILFLFSEHENLGKDFNPRVWFTIKYHHKPQQFWVFRNFSYPIRFFSFVPKFLCIDFCGPSIRTLPDADRRLPRAADHTGGHHQCIGFRQAGRVLPRPDLGAKRSSE